MMKRLYPNEYGYIRDSIYPKLRAVTFCYSLRRKNMEQDTIHTTEQDTLYGAGVEHLKRREYTSALDILAAYRDRNTAVALLSCGKDVEAFEILLQLPQTAENLYLLAVACTRIGRRVNAAEYYKKACNLDEKFTFRGRLDPEIVSLTE